MNKKIEGFKKAQLSKESVAVIELSNHFEPLSDIKSFCQFSGDCKNTVGHYLASCMLIESLVALIRLGYNPYLENDDLETAASIRDGIPINNIHKSLLLHKILSRRRLLPIEAIGAVMRTPVDFMTSEKMEPIVKNITDTNQAAEEDAAFLLDKAISEDVPHARLYKALFYLEKNYGQSAAQEELNHYIQEQTRKQGDSVDSYIDPLFLC